MTFSTSVRPPLPTADAFLKAAVSVLPEVPRSISIEGKLRSSENFLLDFVNNFLATLLVIPVMSISSAQSVFNRLRVFFTNLGTCNCLQDHPEHGVLYLVRGLLNMVQDYTWEENSDAKMRVYVSALPLLAAMSQETYIYSVPKGNIPHTEVVVCTVWHRHLCFLCLILLDSVDSNETLYGGDPKFLSEINKLSETLIGQVLDHLKTLGREEVGDAQKHWFMFTFHHYGHENLNKNAKFFI